MVVIMEYLRRRISGLPPFAADDEDKFVSLPEKIKPPQPLKLSTKGKRKQDL
jgi:hypothetical protein